MFRTAVLFSLLVLASPAHAWDSDDTKRQLAYTSMHFIDWGQTLDISANCGPQKIRELSRWGTGYFTRETPAEVSEMNPYLGSCPDRGEVNRYFLATGLIHYGISRALPGRYRQWWQRITISYQAGVVDHNVSIGLSVAF